MNPTSTAEGCASHFVRYDIQLDSGEPFSILGLRGGSFEDAVAFLKSECPFLLHYPISQWSFYVQRLKMPGEPLQIPPHKGPVKIPRTVWPLLMKARHDVDVFMVKIGSEPPRAITLKLASTGINTDTITKTPEAKITSTQSPVPVKGSSWFFNGCGQAASPERKHESMIKLETSRIVPSSPASTTSTKSLTEAVSKLT